MWERGENSDVIRMRAGNQAGLGAAGGGNFKAPLLWGR